MNGKSTEPDIFMSSGGSEEVPARENHIQLERESALSGVGIGI